MSTFRDPRHPVGHYQRSNPSQTPPKKAATALQRRPPLLLNKATHTLQKLHQQSVHGCQKPMHTSPPNQHFTGALRTTTKNNKHSQKNTRRAFFSSARQQQKHLINTTTPRVLCTGCMTTTLTFPKIGSVSGSLTLATRSCGPISRSTSSAYASHVGASLMHHTHHGAYWKRTKDDPRIEAARGIREVQEGGARSWGGGVEGDNDVPTLLAYKSKSSPSSVLWISSA